MRPVGPQVRILTAEGDKRKRTTRLMGRFTRADGSTFDLAILTDRVRGATLAIRRERLGAREPDKIEISARDELLALRRAVDEMLGG